MIKNDYFSRTLEHADFLVNGKIGLSITFWFYGGFGLIILTAVYLALSPKEGGCAQILFNCFAAIYYTIVVLGIWNSANKYVGPHLWRVLSKGTVLLITLPTIILLIKKIY